jgi:acetyl-CoA carboxylase biotin carboxyl carrier protein
MKMEEIQSLAQIMREAELTCLEVTEGENKIRLERQISVMKESGVCTGNYPTVPDALQAATNAEVPDAANYKEIKSPLVGVFYASPSPESESYVKVGSKIKKGDVLCVIEAMKLLNELNSDMDGEIVEICAGNGQVVEYGQTLFKVR